MANTKTLYLGVGLFVLLLIVSFFIGFGRVNENLIKNTNFEQTNTDLVKYRSEDIPEDCRLPEYESNIEWWKQHLSHHQQTSYCLEYYGTNIEELKGGGK